MGKARLIPKLQLRRASFDSSKLVLVVTNKFANPREIGDPVSQAKIFQDQKADELIFVNIDERRVEDLSAMAKILKLASEEIFTPITAGGGVRSLEDIKYLLNHGADKVVINSHALLEPEFIKNASKKFGSQCIVVSVDLKKNTTGDYEVFSKSINKTEVLTPENWACTLEHLGAGELLLTCVDSDGQNSGLEHQIIKSIVDAVSIPVIASGGCGLASHFTEGFNNCGCSAIAAGTFFAKKDQNFIQTRAHIHNAGINIRV